MASMGIATARQLFRRDGRPKLLSLRPVHILDQGKVPSAEGECRLHQQLGRWMPDGWCHQPLVCRVGPRLDTRRRPIHADRWQYPAHL